MRLTLTIDGLPARVDVMSLRREPVVVPAAGSTWVLLTDVDADPESGRPDEAPSWQQLGEQLAAGLPAGGDAAVAVQPVTDTIKVVEAGLVAGTVDRSRLWREDPDRGSMLARRAVLRASLDQGAVASAPPPLPVWAQLLADAGHRVVVVPVAASASSVAARSRSAG